MKSMNKIVAMVLMFSMTFANATAFTSGQVLTAQALNTAFAAAQVTSGTIDGAVIGGVQPMSGTFTSLYSTTPDTSGYNATFKSFSATGTPNAALAFKSARGTLAAPTATQTGDLLGNEDFFGYSNAYAYAASVDVVADGAFSTTSTPTKFNWNVTPVSSVTPALTMSLNGNGVLSLPSGNSSLHVSGVDQNYYSLSAVSYNNAINGTGIQLLGARGTAAAPSATVAGDTLGNIDFYGQNTSTLATEGASENAIAASTWSATNSETSIAWNVTPASSIVASEKMRLSSNGTLLVGTSAVPSAATVGSTAFPTTATGDVIAANGGVLSLSTESAGNYNFTGLGYSTANTNNASIGLKSQTRGAAATASGDTIGNFDFYGWTGSAYGYAANIDVTAAGAWSGSSMPTQVLINTTPVSGVAPSLSMSISNAGVNIPSTTATSSQTTGALVVAGGIGVGGGVFANGTISSNLGFVTGGGATVASLTASGVATIGGVLTANAGISSTGTATLANVTSSGTNTAATMVGTGYRTASAGVGINTTAAVSAVTIAATVSSTYIATPAATATVTLRAPSADGDRTRVCFGAASTVTWAVTAPATATAGLPTAIAAGQCVEARYVSVAGTPANAAATTWYVY